ncbi:MAG: hypothetical protein ACKN9W_17205 [Methylococcus sp.]
MPKKLHDSMYTLAFQGRLFHLFYTHSIAGHSCQELRQVWQAITFEGLQQVRDFTQFTVSFATPDEVPGKFQGVQLEDIAANAAICFIWHEKCFSN